MGLAAEIPAAELQSMFEKNGHRIFGSPRLLPRFFRVVKRTVFASHGATGLRGVLTERFGSTTIGDLNHRVLIPAVNYSTGRGQFFKTPHARAYQLDHTLTLVDVGLATAAAPTYFPLHRIEGRGTFADGGLVANSPGLLGLHETRHGLALPRDTTVRVLGIGTMSLGASVRGSALRSRGLTLWGGKVFDLVISAQDYAAHAMLTHELRGDYMRIDESATPDQSKDISKLDLASKAAARVLTERGFHSAQVHMGDEGFQKFLKHLAAPPQFFHGPNKNV